MLQSVVNYSKAWSRALSAIALGLLVITTSMVLISDEIASKTFAEGTENLSKLSVISVSKMLLQGFAAYFIGVISIGIGNALFTNTFSIERVVRREAAIYETQNPLIIDRYRQYLAQADVLSGIVGAFLLIILVSTICGIVVVQPEPSQISKLVGVVILLVCAVLFYLASRFIYRTMEECGKVAEELIAERRANMQLDKTVEFNRAILPKNEIEI